MIRVSIIVLNWNQAGYTIRCIKSILKQNYKSVEILVVDNGSSDDSIAKLEKAFSKNKTVSIIKNRKNEGYAGGNNLGAEFARGKYVVILNNDTTVKKGWLPELIRGLESSRDVASVCSEEIRNSVMEDIDYHVTRVSNSFLSYSIRNKYPEPLDNIDFIELFPIKGVSFIYRKSLANPPFDKDYFLYAEDFYLGWLFKLKGYRNLMSTKSVVNHYHKVSTKSSKEISKLATFYGERNKLLNAFLFLEKKNLFRMFFPMLVSTFLINVFQPAKIPSRMKSYWWLITHIGTMKRKRMRLQKQRKVSDDELLTCLSYKVFDEIFVKNIFLKSFLYAINLIIFLYYKFLGMRFMDL